MFCRRQSGGTKFRGDQLMYDRPLTELFGGSIGHVQYIVTIQTVNMMDACLHVYHAFVNLNRIELIWHSSSLV